ncbi:MAG TPA: 3'-5' exonuclease [Oscillatoriaceae cyanobacterium]
MTARFVVLDLETTGLDAELEGILEVAALRLEDGRPSAVFHSLVRPEVPISPSSYAVHGIDAGRVEESPPIEALLPDLLDFFGSDPLVAHNAGFDLSFLNRALVRAGRSPLENPVFDTLELAREVFPEQRSHKLEALCKLLGHPASDFHRALDDARHLAAIFPQLLERYRQKEAWYRAQFDQIEQLAQRYDQLGRLIESLQTEQADVRRILSRYFAEAPETRLPLDSGDWLASQRKDLWDYPAELLLPLLDEWGLKERFSKLDRARLERWLQGDRLSAEQKERIAALRYKTGTTQRIAKLTRSEPPVIE